MKKKQGGCRTAFVIWGIVTVMIGFALNSINKAGENISTIIFGALVLGVSGAFLVFCICMVIITSKIKIIERKQRQKDRAEGISRYNRIIHIGGLNAPKNYICNVILNPSRLVIECGGNEFSLGIKKIRNVDFQLDINEQQYFENSAADGIFGVSGAVDGTTLRTTIKRDVKCYAIISYDDNQGRFRTFILRDEVPNLSVCARLVDTLKPMINVRMNKVEL